jgi:glycerol-3-phosphate dehydrogenase
MLKNWSARKRDEQLDYAGKNHFDLVIIGGGITGAGIARECALRGLSFCLLDKNDFAFGTSSRSSKLFHGGMRYLAAKEFGLVRESTSERNWLRCHLPNLVRPLGFIYPSYQRYRATPFMVRIAVYLYDLLSNTFAEFKNYRKSQIFKASFVEEVEPAVALEIPELGKMTIAGFYYDTNCDDARVTLEIIKESLVKSKGRSTALNYTAVMDFLRDRDGKVNGVVVTDRLAGISFNVHGRCVVSATGVWTDRILSKSDYRKERIYPTKGVHLAVPAERLGNRNAFSLVSLDDGRFFFVLRRGRVSLIGTTDTDYLTESTNLDEPWCNREDCDYLLRTVNRMFPRARLTDADIIGAYAGIRPLIKQEGAKTESAVSRNHEIFKTAEGIVAIAGGKSTTHRRMAEDLIYYLIKEKKLEPFADPKMMKLGYSKQPFAIGLTRSEFDHLVLKNNLQDIAHPDQHEHFYTQYGRGGLEILTRIKEHPQTGTPLLAGYPYCEAEILYILEYENAPRLCDLLCRRTEAQWTVWHYKQPELAEPVASIMASYYHWSAETKAAELAEYLDYVAKSIGFLKHQR